jgi:hypothetical protein
LASGKKTGLRSFAELLAGGDRRSIGRASAAAKMALADRARFPQLLKCMWSEDPVVRMRAADATEKVSAKKPELLRPFKAELLGLAQQSTQQELRWHLALMLPRLPLSAAERQATGAVLKEYLEDRSSIVRTLALQGLWDLSQKDSELLAEVRAILEQTTRTGTAAMKARARKLLTRG